MRLARFLRSNHFDLIHSYLRTPGLLARLASIASPKTRVIISERNVDIDHSHWRLLLERLMAKKGDAMIANAEAVRSKVTKLIPRWRGRIYVVPNGISFSEIREETLGPGKDFRARYISKANQVLLGVVGRLEPQKDPHLLLDALERLSHKSLARIRVVWVGSWNDPKLTASLQERLDATGLCDYVHILRETHQIRVVYNAIDGLVLASRWEGFPNVVLEALAEGKPVIATDVGDVRLLVEHGKSGWVVPPGDASKLADAIRQLSDMTPARREEMGKSGSIHVRNLFSSEILAKRTLKVYDSVLNQ
jgi:glycosyltransferase involved in cell wall biosynthesis